MTVGKILVTGASGLLGANVCRIAVEQGRSVRGLVRKDADAEVLKTLGVEPALGDVCDPASLARAMQGIDGVIHSAAVIGGAMTPCLKSARDDRSQRRRFGCENRETLRHHADQLRLTFHAHFGVDLFDVAAHGIFR